MPTSHLLARAVIRKKDHVLVVQADGQSHTFLPGGHHEEGEGMATCLRRELGEELGIHPTIRRYLGAVEHRWKRDGQVHYELNHCFAVEAPSLSVDTIPQVREDHLTFDWVPVGKLQKVTLQPSPLRRLLVGAPDGGTPWWASTLDTPPLPDREQRL